MIEVVISDLVEAETDGILRTVGADLEAATPLSRRVAERAGPDILEQLANTGETPVGGALITPGGSLDASFLIHAVIRSPEEPVSESAVARALLNALRQATAWGLDSLALPPVGTGAGNLDAEQSARVMIPMIRTHLNGAGLPRKILIVVGSEYERDAFERALEGVESPA